MPPYPFRETPVAKRVSPVPGVISSNRVSQLTAMVKLGRSFKEMKMKQDSDHSSIGSPENTNNLGSEPVGCAQEPKAGPGYATAAYVACLQGVATPNQQRSVASQIILLHGLKGEMREALVALHAVARTDDKNYAAVTNAAAVIAKATRTDV